MGNLPTLWLTAMDLPTEVLKCFEEEGLDKMGLEWCQVDLQRRLAWIHADQAKAGKPIGVPLNKDATLVLRQPQERHAQRVFT